MDDDFNGVGSTSDFPADNLLPRTELYCWPDWNRADLFRPRQERSRPRLIHPSASPIWPPTGFALAAIVLWGYRAWPAIFLGAMIANASTTGSIGPAISIATGNSLEALVGAAVINIWSNGRDTFSTPNTVAKFAVICVVLATPISATVGITTLAIAGYAEWANFANIWLTWWLGDMIGALVVTPVVVLCALSDARAFRST